MEGERFRSRTRDHEVNQGRYRADSNYRSEEQEQTPSAPGSRAEAEPDAGGRCIIRQQTRHYSIRKNWVEEVDSETDQYESEELLAITAYVARQSKGMPIGVSIDGAAKAHFEAGEAAYRLRRGQMNLSCAHCHEANWGKRLLSETISQGQPNGYPAYRMEWQTMGSLERRLRACLSGVRAEMLPYGSPEYLDLELYLAWRAQGLPIETPGVRR